MKNILVVGSINMDLVIHTDRLPKLGETITGFAFATNPGGKGANQAVTTARLGQSVCMIGAVGQDSYGTQLVNTLKSNAIGCEGVHVTDTSTGIAVITVCNGDNHIILDKGANAQLSPTMLNKNESLFEWADMVLFQLEIPQLTILHAAKLAKKHGAMVVLNPAPMQSLMPELLPLIDLFTPNQHEAEQILGMSVQDEDSQADAIRKLMQIGIHQVIITLGNKGCVYNEESTIKRHDIYPVEAVDTTAAGDSFIGGLCSALCEGYSLDEAVSYATAVSALVVSKTGAIPSLPFKQDVENFLQKYLY